VVLHLQLLGGAGSVQRDEAVRQGHAGTADGLEGMTAELAAQAESFAVGDDDHFLERIEPSNDLLPLPLHPGGAHARFKFRAQGQGHKAAEEA